MTGGSERTADVEVTPCPPPGRVGGVRHRQSGVPRHEIDAPSARFSRTAGTVDERWSPSYQVMTSTAAGRQHARRQALACVQR